MPGTRRSPLGSKTLRLAPANCGQGLPWQSSSESRSPLIPLLEQAMWG